MYIVIFIILAVIMFCLMSVNVSTAKKETKEIKRKQHRANDLEKRRLKSYKRNDRISRHNRIWGVLRFIKEFEGVMSSNSFYDLDKATTNFKQAQDRLLDEDYTPTEDDITTAVRFCQYQFTTKHCIYKLSQKDVERIYNWREFSYDEHKALTQAAERFKCYWNEVILNYKRPSDKVKREKYLIEHLEEMKGKDTFSRIPASKEIFDELISYYS